MDRVRTGEAERVRCRNCGQALDVTCQPPLSMTECPACHARQPVPVRFGRWILLARLGSGGMGEVFRAREDASDVELALKIMKPALTRNPSTAQAFLREAELVAAIRHPNVVRILSWGHDAGQPYIAMELACGGLDELIAAEKQLAEVHTLEIGLDAAEGLQAMHEVGLIHADLKPSNILIGADGEAKVSDFGLAQLAGLAQCSTGTAVWGTPHYIAPEVAQGRKPDQRSDLYSLGATLYHTLAGHPPFDGQTVDDAISARLDRPVPSLRTLRPSIHTQTDECLLRMLDLDPSKRFPSCAEFAKELHNALQAVSL